jgi:glycosyltransferase 2 family protein
MKVPVKTIIGAVGVVAAIAWSLKGVSFHEIYLILKEMEGYLVLAVLVLTTSNLLIRSMVWMFIVSPIKRVPLLHAVSSYLIGVFSNLFLPFKLGDVAQGYSLGRRDAISKISAVSAVIVQRVFEFVSLLIIMASVATVFSFPSLYSNRIVMVGVILVGAAIVFTIITIKRKAILHLIEKTLDKYSTSIAARIRQSVELFIIGTSSLHSIYDIIKILFMSLLSWGVQILMVMLTVRAMDIRLSFIASSIVLMTINIGLLIPLAPGNIGTFQVFSIIALSWFGVEKPVALTFSIIFQAIQGLPVILGGGFSILTEMVRGKQVFPKA